MNDKLFNAKKTNEELGEQEQFIPPKKEFLSKEDWQKGRDNKIANAQAYNLAVALLAPNIKEKGVDSEEMKKNIIYWQAWFYSQLEQK